MGAALSKNSKLVLILENIPIVGHCVAIAHAIGGNGAEARRAIIKTTNGFIVATCTVAGGAIGTLAAPANPIAGGVLGAAIGGAVGGGLGLTYEGAVRERLIDRFPEDALVFEEGMSKLTLENYVWAIGIGAAQGAAGGAIVAKMGGVAAKAGAEAVEVASEPVMSAASATLRSPAAWSTLSKMMAKEITQGLVKGTGKFTKSQLQEHMAKNISHGFIDLNLVGQAVAVVRKAVIAELLPAPEGIPDKNVMFWSSIITGPYLVKGRVTLPVFGKIGHEWVIGKCVFAADGDVNADVFADGDVNAWYPWGGTEHYFKLHVDSNDMPMGSCSARWRTQSQSTSLTLTLVGYCEGCTQREASDRGTPVWGLGWSTAEHMKSPKHSKLLRKCLAEEKALRRSVRLRIAGELR